MYEFTTEQTDFLNSSGKVVFACLSWEWKNNYCCTKVVDYLKGWDNPHKGIAVLSFLPMLQVKRLNTV